MRKQLLSVILSALILTAPASLQAAPETAPTAIPAQNHASLQHYFTLNEAEIRKLTENPRSPKTLTLQTWLKVAGFFPYEIDGLNGGDTRSAIRNYEESIGQTPTGIPAVSWEAPLESYVRKRAQEQLYALGYFDGDINGVNNYRTQNAIKAFEKASGLKESGTLAPEVLFFLFNPQFLPENPSRPLPKKDQSPKVSSTGESFQKTDSPQDQISHEVVDSSIEEATYVALPTIQDSLENLKTAQEEAKRLAQLEAEKAEAARKKAAAEAERKARIKAAQELVEPMQIFSLDRAAIDALIIQARRADIFFIQVSLHLLDLYNDPIDGQYGPTTRQAIKDFETMIGQRESGKLLPRWQTPLRQMMYRFVQKKLTDLNFYDGEIDGIAGRGTVEAIKNFEASLNIEQFGRVTPALLLAMFNDESVAVPLEAPPENEENESEEAIEPISAEENQELKEKEKGSDTLQARIAGFDLSHPKASEEQALLQLKLAYLGFYTTTVDGLTGPAMNRAIEAFQTAFSLPKNGQLEGNSLEKLKVENINKFQRYLQRVDYMKDRTTGKLGPKTRRAVSILKNRHGFKIDEAMDIPLYLILIDQEQGSNFAKRYLEEVVKVQEDEALVKTAQGFLVGLGEMSGRVDGINGPATKRAIRQFREKHKLKAGDMIDTEMIATLEKVALKQAQTYLQALGYALKPDGIFGPNSQKHLNSFLKSQKMPASNEVTYPILLKLKEASEKKATVQNRRAPTQSRGAAPATTTRKSGTMPRLQKGLQQDKILSQAPTNTVNGKLQIVRDNAGNVAGCRIGNITMGPEWCAGKRNGANCRVLYKGGRVLSMNCK